MSEYFLFHYLSMVYLNLFNTYSAVYVMLEDGRLRRFGPNVLKCSLSFILMKKRV